ncbi:hypothetical protein YC2023_102662 [Brassica napus]
MGNLVMVGPQEFVVCRRVVPRQFYINLPYDGFVGLGLPLPANIDADDTDEPGFSLYLRNYHFHGNDGGRLSFGGVSQEHYEGHHQYFDLVDNSNQWKIHMYSVSVAGHLVVASTFRAGLTWGFRGVLRGGLHRKRGRNDAKDVRAPSSPFLR